MARVREYAAQKKVRTEVKRASGLHQSSNLLSRLTKDKKTMQKKAEITVSLRRIVDSSPTSTITADGILIKTNISSNRDLTMWDIVGNDSKQHQTSGDKVQGSSHTKKRGKSNHSR